LGFGEHCGGGAVCTAVQVIKRNNAKGTRIGPQLADTGTMRGEESPYLSLIKNTLPVDSIYTFSLKAVYSRFPPSTVPSQQALHTLLGDSK